MQTGNKITQGYYLTPEDRRLIVKALFQMETPSLTGVPETTTQNMAVWLLEIFTNAENVHVRHSIEQRVRV